MASSAPTLKAADIELLMAVCEQFGEVDSKKLGEKLGCSNTAAYKRWKRFKERTFGDDKKNDEANGDEGGEGSSQTPKTPKVNGGKKTTGSTKSTAKRARADDDGNDAEGTPTKKPTAKKNPRIKKTAAKSEEDSDEGKA